MSRIFIKPSHPEMKVRKPVNGHLAVDGEWVNQDSYWLRRINDGDVVVAEAEPEATPPGAGTGKPVAARLVK